MGRGNDFLLAGGVSVAFALKQPSKPGLDARSHVWEPRYINDEGKAWSCLVAPVGSCWERALICFVGGAVRTTLTGKKNTTYMCQKWNVGTSGSKSFFVGTVFGPPRSLCLKIHFTTG